MPVEKVNDLIEKTTDLAMTGNNTAQTALDKLNTVFAKNKGLISCAKIIRGEGVTDPVQIGVYSFAPCTSVDVERFFSVLKSFVEDRPNLTPENLEKLMFIRYNKYLNL